MKPLVTQLKPEGSSGYGGVTTNGSQLGSAGGFGVPSSSACRIAVIGRQKLQYALLSQQPISESAPDRFSIPKSRASSLSVSPCCAAIARKVRFHIATA